MRGPVYFSRLPTARYAAGAVSDFARYHRQMLLPGWGHAGQERLQRSHAAIVGLGALGSGIADMLSRAGVGTLTLIDRDVVELTNLQRQTLYTTQDAAQGIPKAQAAKERLESINPEIRIDAHATDLTHRNVEALIPGSVDVILDGTDNFATRYLLNDVCVKRGTPLCYGGVIATHGMQATLTPGKPEPHGACLRCMFEEPPPAGSTPTCDTAGVLGPVVGIVAAAQAADALKILLGQEHLLSHSLLEFDIWASQRRRLDLSGSRRTDCPCCGMHAKLEFLNGEREGAEAPHLCGQNAVQIPGSPGGTRVNLESLGTRLASHGVITGSGMFVRLECAQIPGGWKDQPVLTVFSDGRAIIKGTSDPAQARTLYARLIGV